MEKAVEAIENNSQKIKGSDDIARVATISSADEYIGKLIAEAMDKVSSDGVITVEESKTAETYSEVVEGMMFDRGYIAPYMVTDTEKWLQSLTIPTFLLQIRRFPTFRKFFLSLSRLSSPAKAFAHC